MLEIINSEIEDSYSREYIFAPDIAELDKKMVKLLKANQKYFSTAIKFGDKRMHVFNGNGFNITQDFVDLTSLNPDVQDLLGLLRGRPKSLVASLVGLKNIKPWKSQRKTKPQAALAALNNSKPRPQQKTKP